LSNGTSAAFAQLTGDQAARFNLAKFSYLATVGAPPGLWLVGPDSAIREVKQAIDAKTKWRWASQRHPGAEGARPQDLVGREISCNGARLRPSARLPHRINSKVVKDDRGLLNWLH
jgi:hypothetical protein